MIEKFQIMHLKNAIVILIKKSLQAELIVLNDILLIEQISPP